PTKTYRGKNQQWMQNAQTMISSVLGQDPEYIASRFADNKKFREENLNVDKAGSLAFKMQGVRNMADPVIDQNARFKGLGPLDQREGDGLTPAWLQEGMTVTVPHLGTIGPTASLNTHAYDNSGDAKAFNTYEQTLGNENNKFMVPGSGNGTGEERSAYMHS